MRDIISFCHQVAGLIVNGSQIAAALTIAAGAAVTQVPPKPALESSAAVTVIWVILSIIIGLTIISWIAKAFIAKKFALQTAEHIRQSGGFSQGYMGRGEVWVNLQNLWWAGLEVGGLDIEINKDNMQKATVFAPCFYYLPRSGAMQVHAEFLLPAFAVGCKTKANVVGIVVREIGKIPIRGAILPFPMDLDSVP